MKKSIINLLLEKQIGFNNPTAGFIGAHSFLVNHEVVDKKLRVFVKKSAKDLADGLKHSNEIEYNYLERREYIETSFLKKVLQVRPVNSYKMVFQ